MTKTRTHLLRTTQLYSIMLWTILILASAQAQTPAVTTGNRTEAKGTLAVAPRLVLARGPAGFRLTPATGSQTNSKATSPLQPAAMPPLQVVGNGTVGQLTKWTAFTSSQAEIGNSVIFESATGNVGIGTTTPTTKLMVGGTIESFKGGFKFPDGTIQVTAANNSLTVVAHDATLIGNGTSPAPLGVAIPLSLSGSVLNDFVVKITNTGAFGYGVKVTGNSDDFYSGGDGIQSTGGNGGHGGNGVNGFGGSGVTTSGGTGVSGVGGNSSSVNGGPGMVATGGIAAVAGDSGGIGIIAFGGPGIGGATSGLAGQFFGNVQVTGNLSKGGGSFKIDHPLDPENKYLYHSFVESPDMLNIYNGNITTDNDGEAIITLPDWFEALNRDFRYQLTVIGIFAQAIVADEIKDNRFTIKTNAPNVKVSWQVTGIRQDAYANKHRIPVKEAKPAGERGYYLHPDAFNQPEEKNVFTVQNPQAAQRLKEMRRKAQSDNQ